MSTKCRICNRVAVANLDKDSGLLGVCGLHHDYLVAAMKEAAPKEAQDRFIGFGYPIEEVAPDGFAALRCDKSSVSSPHSWTGQPGASCHWCLVSFVIMMREHRSTVLQDPESDVEDQRYESECRRKGEALKYAVKIGLVTTEEALNRFDRWVSYV